jgi:MoxR-like ATPase
LTGWLRWGASPRAAIAIERGARALAWLDGRDYVSPEDVQAILPSVAGHRLHGQALGATVPGQELAERLLAEVAVP